MQAAVRRSLLESVAVNWMMLKSYQDEDYVAALHYADILLRTRSQAPEFVVPMLGKIAENSRWSDKLNQLLATNPPWRPQFFSSFLDGSISFVNTISDARTPLSIMLSLKDTSNPPTANDLRTYLNFLIKHRFYDLAYYAWLQFLPPEQLAEAGHLFNGSFEVMPSGVPFDWVLPKEGSGVTHEIAARDDQPGKHALFWTLDLDAWITARCTQLILLAPGSYKFRGKL